MSFIINSYVFTTTPPSPSSPIDGDITFSFNGEPFVDTKPNSVTISTGRFYFNGLPFITNA